MYHDVSTLRAQQRFVFLIGEEKKRLCLYHVKPLTVILLQIVMVSFGTHLVKNPGSQSGTSESQFKMSPCVFCNHTVSVNLKTDPMQNSDALQFTEIKMYSYYRKAQQRLKEISPCQGRGTQR